MEEHQKRYLFLPILAVPIHLQTFEYTRYESEKPLEFLLAHDFRVKEKIYWELTTFVQKGSLQP